MERIFKVCEDLKQWLRENNINFEEEVCIVPGKNYSVDIAFSKSNVNNRSKHY